MERYGSITTPVSVPRLIVGAMLAAGVAVLILAFTQYGLLAGLAVSVIPAALCILWVTLRNPAISMLGLFVANYFIMALTRYAHDLPFGMILDALIFYNILIITLQALMRPIEWKRASSGLTVVAAIWMAYCILEIVNPESVSVAGWFSSVRSIAFYFFFIVVLTQLTMTEYKYLKYMLAVWSVLTLIAVGKACMQKFFGFNATGCSCWAAVRHTSSTAACVTSRSSATRPISAARWGCRWSYSRFRRSTTATRG